MKKRGFYAVFFFVLLTLIFTFSCSQKNSNVKTEPIKLSKKSVPDEFKEIVLDTSHKTRPNWVAMTFYKENGINYYVGGDMDYQDYALGVSAATHLAVLNLASSVRKRVRAITGYAQAGDPKDKDKISRVVEDFISTFVNNIEISGISKSEVYYRKYITKYDTTPKYQIFVKIGISESDYRKAVEDAKRKLKEKYKDENDPLIRERLLKLEKELTE